MNMREYPDQYKIHETSSDRQRQQAVLRVFCKALDLYYELTDPLCEYDANLFTISRKIGIAEVKFRNNLITKYPDYQIDVWKIHALLRAARTNNLRAVLIVSWLGDIRYLPLWQVAEGWDEQCDLFSRTNTKRKDRREYADHQYHIPLQLFLTINRKI